MTLTGILKFLAGRVAADRAEQHALGCIRIGPSNVHFTRSPSFACNSSAGTSSGRLKLVWPVCCGRQSITHLAVYGALYFSVVPCWRASSHLEAWHHLSKLEIIFELIVSLVVPGATLPLSRTAWKTETLSVVSYSSTTTEAFLPLSFPTLSGDHSSSQA
eukprot:6186766-Pleurochrysis_carterae.AAC.2